MTIYIYIYIYIYQSRINTYRERVQMIMYVCSKTVNFDYLLLLNKRCFCRGSLRLTTHINNKRKKDTLTADLLVHSYHRHSMDSLTLNRYLHSSSINISISGILTPNSTKDKINSITYIQEPLVFLAGEITSKEYTHVSHGWIIHILL